MMSFGVSLYQTFNAIKNKKEDRARLFEHTHIEDFRTQSQHANIQEDEQRYERENKSFFYKYVTGLTRKTANYCPVHKKAKKSREHLVRQFINSVNIFGWKIIFINRLCAVYFLKECKSRPGQKRK
ncbi:unnamed protein product [Paramecium sonneborni]|uniref:Uncharacterized protein n=1 Tax=Paramecium sonneborni TaxID=65129 RepID=A0A8S1RR43_9CILI|nr:unnamed protein product [Paramecium sonneborni]